MTNADRLAQQILAVQSLVGRRFHPAPDVNATVAGMVAAYMDQNGTRDVRDMRYHYDPAGDGLGFFFDVRTGHVYTNPRAFTVRISDFSSDGSDRNLFTTANAAQNNFAIYLVFTPDGYPVFLGSYWPDQNGWQAFVHGVVFVVGSVVAIAVPALAAGIGEAVLGADVAAAYPALAEGIGNVAVQTALNGGDVQRAVVSAVSGGVGSGVGGVAMSATDSAIIGSVAGSATSAAISGGSMQNAVAGALLKNGISSISQLNFAQAQGAPKMDDTSLIDWGSDPGIFAGDLTGDAFNFPADTPVNDLTFSDMPPGFDFTAPVIPAGTNLPPAGPSGIVASAGGIDLTALAVTGLKLVQAWNNAGKPLPRVSTATAHANADGTLTQVGANGIPVVSRMPVGTPYLLDDGSLVTNNGDGSYTVVGRNGAITTGRYGAGSLFGNLFGSSALGSSPLVPVLAIGAVLLVVMSRKGR